MYYDIGQYQAHTQGEKKCPKQIKNKESGPAADISMAKK